MNGMAERPLRYAMERFTHVQGLALRGGSVALAEAEAAMAEIQAYVAAAAARGASGGDLGAEPGELFAFELAARRTAKLLEGARRTQWIRLRRMRAIGETYTASGELRAWRPRGTVNISA